MVIYAVDPNTGQPVPAGPGLRSVLDRAPRPAPCPSCRATGPLLRREGQSSLLPLRHAYGCRLLDLELVLLMEDTEAAATLGVTEVVSSRRPTPGEVEQLAVLGHEIAPDSTVTTTLTADTRRRVFVTTAGSAVAW